MSHHMPYSALYGNVSRTGVSVVPDLFGPVAVLDNKHETLSVVNVSVLLAVRRALSLSPVPL
jgi:hypothetical protein